MTDFIAEASETDRADQAVSLEDPAEQTEPFDGGADLQANPEADIADVVEQHQSVPSGEDDYAR